MDSEVKNIIISVSSSVILLAVIARMTMVGEVVGKEGRPVCKYKNVVALPFTRKITIIHNQYIYVKQK